MSSTLDRIRARLDRAATQAPPPTETAWTPCTNSLGQSVGPMMPLGLVTYLQVAFFDNSSKPPQPGRKRRNGPHHKVVIEGWTVPAADLNKREPQFQRAITLRPMVDFQDAVIKPNTKSKQISKAFAAELESVMLTSQPTDMFGVILDRNDGGQSWVYHQHQFARVRFDDTDTPILDLFIDGQTWTLNEFSTDHLTERRKKVGITHMQWVDRCGYDNREDAGE